MPYRLRVGDTNILAKAGERAMELTVERASEEMVDTMRAVAPIDTGALESSIDRRRTGNLSQVIEAGEEYARYVIEGTSPHEITGNPLAFEIDGRMIFTRRVQHPGTDPNPFPETALEIEQPRVEGYATDAAAQVRREYGG